MLVSMMRAKLHNGAITGCDLHYEGSVAIDSHLLEASGLLVGEEVHIWNLSNGARIVTYILKGEAGSGEIAVNGAAARHFQKGDRVIIASFAQMTLEEAKAHRSAVLVLAEDNSIQRVID
ncbi:MAG: aspartate 1-decarboxylase [Pseudomonadota bacterium]